MSAPRTKKVITAKKGPCSLCHQVVTELKYHYDICGPCHDSNETELTQSQDESLSEDERELRNGLERAPTEELEQDVDEWSDDDVSSEEENDEHVLEECLKASRKNC